MCGPYNGDGIPDSAAELTSDQIITQLATVAAGPKSVSGDAGSVVTHSIPDLIAASNYLMAIAAKNSPRRGVYFTRLIPDATVTGPRRCQPGPWLGSSWNGYSWP
jgi:hypothetical protein